MKKWQNSLFVVISLLFVMMACVDPLPFEPSFPPDVIVIDGSFTDAKEGVHRVKLTRAAAYTGDPARVYNEPVQGASLKITFDNGGEVFFGENEPGEYEIPIASFPGEVGRRYQLTVEVDGKIYVSSFESIQAVPPIDSLYFEYESSTFRNEFGNLAERCGYAIYVDVVDPDTSTNQYLWHYNYIYEIKTQSPFACCNTCWIRQQSETPPVVAEDALINGNRIVRQRIGYIPYDQFHVKYLVHAEQFSLSPEAYDFWKILAQQQSGSGSIFDPPPSSLEGNMVNVNDSTDRMLGYFRVSGHAEARIMFNLEANACSKDTMIKRDCRELPNSTADYPPDPYWM